MRIVIMSIELRFGTKKTPRYAAYGPPTDVHGFPAGALRTANVREFLTHLRVDPLFGKHVARADNNNPAAQGDTNGWVFGGKPARWRRAAADQGKTFYAGGGQLMFDPRPIVYQHAGRRHTFRMDANVTTNARGSLGTVLFFQSVPADGDSPGPPPVFEFVVKAPSVAIANADTHEREVVQRLMALPELGDIMAAAVLHGSTRFPPDTYPLLALEKFNGSLKDLEATCSLDDAAKLAFAAFEDVLAIYNATRQGGARGLIDVDLKPDNLLYSSTANGGIFVVTVCDYGGFFEEGSATVPGNKSTYVLSSNTRPGRRIVHNGEFMLDRVDVAHLAFTLGTLMVDLWATSNTDAKDRLLTFNDTHNMDEAVWMAAMTQLVGAEGGASLAAKHLAGHLLGLVAAAPSTMGQLQALFASFFQTIGYQPPAAVPAAVAAAAGLPAAAVPAAPAAVAPPPAPEMGTWSSGAWHDGVNPIRGRPPSSFEPPKNEAYNPLMAKLWANSELGEWSRHAGFSTWSAAQKFLYCNNSFAQKYCQCECACGKPGNDGEWETVAPASDHHSHVFTAAMSRAGDDTSAARLWVGSGFPDIPAAAHWADNNTTRKYYIVCEECAANFATGSQHVCGKGPDEELAQELEQELEEMEEDEEEMEY